MATTPTPVPPAPTAADEAATAARERRTMLVAGGVFLGFLVVLIALAAALAGDGGDTATTTTTTVACEEGDAACLAAQRSQERPGIIPRPGEGRAPEEAGDRGGALQVAVLVGVVAALAVIVGLVVRSGRRGRRTPVVVAEEPATRG